ncbi:CDP-glycerol glycerophosphotransferase family protein [Gottfriedia sp. NPDC056225]|uniref:CDP-glycerol glycerophosphotransferase family protein n=1 Tax=Gottfriedia sp. NPDC056225 TaxID=3345751 RepID=UPI001559EE71|nr:hypothetical protein HPK19_20740 [Arthrobacter citreus]
MNNIAIQGLRLKDSLLEVITKQEIVHENDLSFYLENKSSGIMKKLESTFTLNKDEIVFKIKIEEFQLENEISQFLVVAKDSNNESFYMMGSPLTVEPNKYTNCHELSEEFVVISHLENRLVSLTLGKKQHVTKMFSEINHYKFSSIIEIENLRIEGPKVSFNISKDLILNKPDLEFFLRERTTKEVFILNFKINQQNEVEIDLNEFASHHIEKISRWDAVATFKNENVLVEGKISEFNQKVPKVYDRFFKSFDVNLSKNELTESDLDDTGLSNVVTPYTTSKNELSIVIRPELFLFNEKFKTKISVTKFKMKKSIVSIKANLSVIELSDFKVSEVYLRFRNKATILEHSIPATERKISENNSEIEFSFDLEDFKFMPFYWDLYVIVNVNGEKNYVKVKNPFWSVRKKLDTKILKYEYMLNDQYMIYPYVAGDNSIAFCYRERADYETAPFKLKEKLAYFTYKLFKPYFDKKDIWLGYEKFSSTAQDNGYYFFDYCYKHNKHKDFYYIIKENSADRVNLEDKKDKVLTFMSFKYMLYMYASKLLVSSESKGHSYDIRIQKGQLKKALDQKRFVFLQHGVTALKRVDYVFKKTKTNAVDLFVATSDYEKNIIKQYFGYDEDEIIVSGFCRWDVLQDKSLPEEKEIFLMPTWRSWMDGIPEEEFIQSDYFKNYVELLTSSKLKQLLVERNITLNFFLHPKFMEHLHHFKATNDKINIYQFGEIKVNEFLMKSSMLITDYSSVAWEMYYQKKPTLFFQFDIDKYTKFQGSYLDMEKELFGERSLTVQDLIQQIEKYVNRDFKEEEEYAEMRKKYFKYIDQNNSLRTFDYILENKDKLYIKNTYVGTKVSFYQKISQNELVRAIWNVGKKNKLISKFSLKTKNLLKGIS